MTFKFEGWCGSDRCQKISIAGRKLEINNQQATLNTLAYIKARTISPKGKTWSRSSKITSLEEDMFETEDQQKASDPKKQERERKDVLICHQTYDVCMKGLIPKMRPAKLLDPILFQLFHYCHTTWRDSAAPVRQELIDLSAHWTELGLQGPCPFSPTEAELKEHAQHYEDFETIQKLKLFLKSSLHTNSDGWVLNDAWDAAKDARRAANDEWIQTARESESRGEGLSIAKADKMWPFDAR